MGRGRRHFVHTPGNVVLLPIIPIATSIEKYPLSLHNIFTITNYPDSEGNIIINQGVRTMEQQRTNWPAWIALGVSLVALIVAFGSMAVSQQSAWSMWTMPGWSNPPQVAPPGWGERGGPGHAKPPGPGHAKPPGPGHAKPPGPGHAKPPGPGHAMSPGPGHAMPPEPGHAKPPGPGQAMPPGPGLGELIRFIDGLLKLAALALLIWLGFKIFRQRRNQPPSTNPPTTPQPPLTPAGHDPRVE